MTPKLLALGYCAALVLCGFGLLQFRATWSRKAGLLCFWAASGGAVWALSGFWWAGAATLGLWIAFPISEMVIVLRRLQIPRERVLEEAIAPLEEFPELRSITHELEEIGFHKVEDCNLTPTVQEQFYRLFGHADGLHHGVIGFVTEGNLGFDFIAFSSEDRQGRQWVTWDYPLSYGLKMPPQVILHRTLHCTTVAELFEAHRELLHLNGVGDTDLVAGSDLAAVRGRLERSLARQLQYNVSIGILSPGRAEADGLRYSWRGAFYVASEVMRDLVRL